VGFLLGIVECGIFVGFFLEIGGQFKNQTGIATISRPGADGLKETALLGVVCNVYREKRRGIGELETKIQGVPR
jgi:hypothetical protein